MYEELKPCVVCKGNSVSVIPPDERYTSYRVRCNDCGYVKYTACKDRASAIAEWNRRVSDE